MSGPDLTELERLRAKATGGTLEWINFNPKVVFFPRNTNEVDYNGVITTDGELADANDDTRYLLALWNAAPALIAAARERDELKAEVWRLEAGLERLSVATSQLLSGGTFEIDEGVNATPEEATGD